MIVKYLMKYILNIALGSQQQIQITPHTGTETSPASWGNTKCLEHFERVRRVRDSFGVTYGAPAAGT